MFKLQPGRRLFWEACFVGPVCWSFALSASGQTLGSVLRAVQERQIAVAQQQHIFTPALDVPVLIAWQAGGSNPPTIAPLPNRLLKYPLLTTGKIFLAC